MFSTSRLRIALLAGCSGLAMALAAPQAQALTLSVQWSYSVGASPISDSDTLESVTSIDVYPSQTGSDGSSVFGHHYGYADGAFGTRSSGNGNFEKQGSSVWSDTFTNNGPDPITLSGSFVIDAGGLSMYMPDTTGGYFASILAEIRVDGNAVFSSAAEMEMSNGGTPVLTTTGTVLNPGGESLNPGSGSYYWGSYLGTVSLGTLAPGDSVSVAYLLASYTSGILAGCGEGGYGGYGGYGGLADIREGYGGYGGTSCYNGYAESRIGDPIEVSGSQFQLNATVATPEPASMAVLGAGLAALAFRRRRAARA